MQRNLRPNRTHPVDFEKFWEKTMVDLSLFLPETNRETLPPSESEPWVQEKISFSSLGGVRIYGYLLHWQDSKKRPLIIHSHGYGSQCEIRKDWAMAGLNVLGVDIRGFGQSKRALPTPSPWGYVLTGIQSPEEYILRGAVSDYVRTAQVASKLLGEKIDRLIFHGMSFAGGIALMSQAVSQMADFLVLAVPTFGWAEGRQFFVKNGSGSEIAQYLSKRPEATEDLMLVLRYFDPINFAEFVTCPTLVGLGLQDDVVPAKTVFAIANHLGGPKEVMEFPISHSDHPDEKLWDKFEKRWIQLALNGIPPSFGK